MEMMDGSSLLPVEEIEDDADDVVELEEGAGGTTSRKKGISIKRNKRLHHLFGITLRCFR